MSRVAKVIRERVRSNAKFRCEYCRIPETYSSILHQVDHIISVKHDGSDELDNLACACFDCNNAKGSDVGSYDKETGVLTPFFNPRTQSWSDHFEIVDGVIYGLTSVGRVTVRLFQMNHPERIEMRLRYIEEGLWD